MEINGSLIKYEDGKIWKFKKYKNSKQDKWIILEGCSSIHKITGYKIHLTRFNGKNFVTARLIYKLHNPDWNINDNSSINTIDHININSLDNRIENLRVATMLEQTLNRKITINAKGYYWVKSRQKWQAYISINNKSIFLGRFKKEEDARQAYLNAVNERIKI
jgi:hypothetical protein